MHGLASVNFVTDTSLKLAEITWSGSKVYLFWILVHYLVSNSYGSFCTPKSTYGFLTSPILVSSPHCKALRWAHEISGSTIDNMWIIFGTWIANKIV